MCDFVLGGPTGIETVGNDVYVNCLCGRREYWMKRASPLMVFPLPEGWSALSPIFHRQVLCPECGKRWDEGNNAGVA